jgi:archaemetzincin
MQKKGPAMSGDNFSELERRLRSLADPLPHPRPGDWLAEHPEPGQSFAEYVDSHPVRRSETLRTIYLCLVGDFTETQRQILALAGEYLGVFFDCPLRVQRQISLTSIPARAKRTHPSWGDQQLLTGYLLHEVLKPERPNDALAYLALTASDLWPGRGWNFVFGQANLQERIGVWSIYRNGDPGGDFKLCLRRTLSTASHEVGHILGMAHCTAFLCLMNGSNHQQEKDQRPLHLCPVCLAKLCWNLRVEPVAYLDNLKKLCQRKSLNAEADWYEEAMAVLAD